MTNLEKQQKILEDNFLMRTDRKLINETYEKLTSGQLFQKIKLENNFAKGNNENKVY